VGWCGGAGADIGIAGDAIVGILTAGAISFGFVEWRG
jgi:hypothetical protein